MNQLAFLDALLSITRGFQVSLEGSHTRLMKAIRALCGHGQVGLVWLDPGTSRVVFFFLKLLYVVFLDLAFTECLPIHCRSPDLCSSLGQ